MAAIPTDVFFSTCQEIHERWRKKEFSAVELARAFGERLETLGPRYNALALPLREEAERRARDIDKERARERYRTPLQAVPFAVKDLLAYPGHPTTWGAKPYAGQVINDTAAALEKLLKAGGVFTGKLSMVELAGGGGYRFPGASFQGPGLNPWSRQHWAGGSSSGSGAAVAAGLVPYALGSETSGSILTPAAFCGVTGLRPTYGLVSRFGAMPLSWTLDKIGPLARSVHDCGLVLAAIAGGDRRDPGSAGKSFYFAPEYVRPLAEMRVAYHPADFSDHADEALRPALQEALRLFREICPNLKETQLPDFPYTALTGTIIGAEGASVFEDLIQSGRVDELADARQIAGLRAALDTPARDYLRAMRIRRLLQEKFAEWFADFDLAIVPTRFSTASRVADPLDRPSGARPANAPRGLRDHVPAGNLAGWPALALPCGFAENLPVSLTVLSRPFSENTILAAGLEFQKRSDWHRRRPPQN